MRFSSILMIILRNLELWFRDLFRLNYRPYKVLLELTEHCNSKCKTCDIWKPNSEKKVELQIKDLEPLLQEYGSNLLWISLGGGEVTLYRNFDSLIELFSLYCPHLRIVTFTTNALIPEKVLAYAQKIKSKGYDVFITISLDGDKQAHDFIRGVEGNYEKAQSVFKQLKEQKIWAHFGLTVSGYNAEFIKNRLASDIEGVRSFSFEHSGGIYKTESVQNEKQILASIRKVRSIYKVRQISEIVEYIYLSLAECFFSSNRKNVPVPCEVIASSLHIRPNGDISPCMYLPKIGSIKSGNLTGLLGATGTRLLRERARNAECSKCWMNCYAVHSIMRHPLISVFESVKVWIGISPNLHK